MLLGKLLEFCVTLNNQKRCKNKELFQTGKFFFCFSSFFYLCSRFQTEKSTILKEIE